MKRWPSGIKLSPHYPCFRCNAALNLTEANLTKNIALKSIGCRTNQEEIAVLSCRLVEQGNRIVDRIDDAEIIIVNTCSVTSCTESKTLRFLNQISRASPHIKICVTGCFAQQKGDDLKKITGAHWIVGNTRKNEIPHILTHESGGVFWDELTHASHDPLHVSLPALSQENGKRTRFPLKIQEGCDNRCAYCIVPSLRGASRSALFTEIETSFKKAVDAGYKEIVLTGTHIGQFQEKDRGGLVDVLNNLLKISGDFRIRLSSLDPRDLTDSLQGVVTQNPNVCKHLHLSVQSLSRRVLDKMNRSGEYVENLAHRLGVLRKELPEMSIGGDFIVGFPGETEDMFEETIGAIKKIGFSYGHVFRYSKREGTAAVLFDEQIPEPEKNRRSQVMRSVLEDSKRAFIQSLIGTTHRIIVEAENPIEGLSSNYLRMEVQNAQAKKNSWLSVTLTGVTTGNNRCTAKVAL